MGNQKPESEKGQISPPSSSPSAPSSPSSPYLFSLIPTYPHPLENTGTLPEDFLSLPESLSAHLGTSHGSLWKGSFLRVLQCPSLPPGKTSTVHTAPILPSGPWMATLLVEWGKQSRILLQRGSRVQMDFLSTTTSTVSLTCFLLYTQLHSALYDQSTFWKFSVKC